MRGFLIEQKRFLESMPGELYEVVDYNSLC